MNFATQLNDLSILRGILLSKVSNRISRTVADEYINILKDIETRIRTHKTIDLKRANKIIKELKDIIKPDLNIYTDLQDLALQERDWTVSSANTSAGVDIFAAIPKDSTILNIANTSAFEGATLSQWVKSLNDSTKFDIERAIRTGVIQGETIEQIMNRVNNVFNTTKRNAETIARTLTLNVTNQVRHKVFEDNSDVLKGWEHSSVIDYRVSSVCAARDGSLWDLNGKGLNAKGRKHKFKKPALHFNCRSILLCVPKTWQELGYYEDEISGSTRSSLDGKISSETKFEDWLKTKSDKEIEKYLGKGRAELFLSKKITLNDLVNANGEELTLDELRKF